MPELPEVEIVCRGLNQMIDADSTIQKIQFFRPNLRWALPKKKCKDVYGLKIQKIERRAKYIFFKLENHWIVSHLGMSGAWREGVRELTHDHIQMSFSDGLELVYNDPRRFGSFEILTHQQFKTDPRWSLLGPEPLSDDFSAEYLFELTRNKKIPIKSFIMDQKNVVGVGNIYAAEALFQARIHPLVQVQKLKLMDFIILVKFIKTTLEAAISQGGSSIHSFVNSQGELGSFQEQHFVYGRAGEKCRVCQNMIKVKVVSGRSTFWCVNCQKRESRRQKKDEL